MKALLRKELAQILPAHLLVALVQAALLAWTVHPKLLLLPSHVETPEAYWIWSLVAILEGTLVGFVQFRRERTTGTEAYLVHRGTGRSRAFTAKVLAATAALILLALAPPGLYGLWHVVLFPGVEHPLTDRIGHFAAVGGCALPGYALGALVAQIRRGRSARFLVGLLGVLTLDFAETFASYSFAGPVSTPLAPFIAFQFVVAVGLLTVARGLFLAGDDEDVPWPRRVGAGGALISLLLVWIPWIFLVASAQQVARMNLFDSYPQIVERQQRELYIVSRIHHRDTFEYEFRDPQGQLAEVDDSRKYSGFASGLDPFLTLFDPTTSRLEHDHPGGTLAPPSSRFAKPFWFDGEWVRLNGENQYPWNRWLRAADGTVWCVGYKRTDEGRSAVVLLTRPDTGQPFSDRTFTTSGLDPVAEALLIDHSDLSTWRVRGREQPAVERVLLPDGDNLVGLEPLFLRSSLRAGIFDQPIAESWLLLLGGQARYVWRDGVLRRFDEPVPSIDVTHGSPLPARPAASVNWVAQSDAEESIAWRFEPLSIDGLGFRLDLLDAKSGALALTHDYRPDSIEQKRWAALAWIASLARSPIGAIWSHFGAHVDPRDVTRLIAYDAFRDPLLLGGTRPGLVAAVLAVGILLVLLAHRRIGSDSRDRPARWTWTIAIAFLGLPAWLLFVLLEPSRRIRTERSQTSKARAQPLIASPGTSRVLKPALSGM